MRRGITVPWHAFSFLLAAGLYFIFVLPRWWELMGDVPHSVGTAMRIVTGVLVGLTALPVVFTLTKTRKPEYGTPQLALTLRVWSIVGHVLAAVLIVATAIAEIWLSLDDVGQWVFGVYGAAAAIAVLGAAAFYLAFVAELPPPPPKPLKPKTAKKASVGDAEADAEDERSDKAADETAAEPSAATSDATEDSASGAASEEEDDSAEEKPADVTADASGPTDAAEPAGTGGRLRNRRPSGKTAVNKRRPSGGVAVSED